MNFTDPSLLWTALWCALALGCGGVIKGALGVGTPLLTVPLMALVLPPQTAVTLMVVPVVMANLWQVVQAPPPARVVTRFWPVLTATLVGCAVGATLLARMPTQALLLVVGCAVIALSVLQAASTQLHIPPAMERPAGAAFGLTAGVIGGLSSFFGPFLVLYLVALRTLDKEQFIGAISVLYLGAVLPWAVSLFWTGLLDGSLLLYSTAAAAPVALGMLLGRRLRSRIDEQRFRHLILLVLLCSGGIILWRGLS